MDIKNISSVKEQCCGCGGCEQACPVGAIHPEIDDLGFYHPTVFTNQCVNCGTCMSKCPITNIDNMLSENLVEVYAAILKDREVLSNSASGGVFAGIARTFIQCGGIVYGAAWTNSFDVAHIRIANCDKLQMLQKSKYTQSSIFNCFKTVESDLLDGRSVLFSGTPCQVAAIKAYLNKDYENLFTMDIVCHGVGSPDMFKDEIKATSVKHHKPVESINFRSKRNGWGASGEIVFQNGKTIDYNKNTSPYYYYYLEGTNYRDSCYVCPFAQEKRVGDLTIGDYWNFKRVHPDVISETDLGVSCLIINTEKGKKLLDYCKKDFTLITSSFDKIATHNDQLRFPAIIPKNRDLIIKNYSQEGYPSVLRCWKKTTRSARLNYQIRKIMPSGLKHKLKTTFIHKS